MVLFRYRYASDTACDRARPPRLRARVQPLIAALVLAVPLMLAFALSAHAQETREHELPELDDDLGRLGNVRARLTLANRFVSKADFGNFEAIANQPELRLRIDVPVSRRMIMRVISTGRFVLYDWDGDSTLATSDSGGAPFGNLYSWGTRLQAGYLLGKRFRLFSDDERWAAIVEAGVKSSWESNASSSDGLRPVGSLALGYRFKKRFEAALGITFSERLSKGGLGVGPLFEFDWRINDDWKLRSYGLGLQVERRLTPSWTTYLRARLEGSGYRLADRGGSVGAGTLGLRQLPFGVGIRHNSRYWTIRSTVGAMFLQRIKIRNEDGDTIGSVTAPPSVFVAVRIDLRT